MAPLNLPWTIAGRYIKPVALGFTYGMFVVTWVTWATDIITVTIGSKVLGVIAFATGIFLAMGWFKNSQKFAELGMLGSLVVWSGATLFLLADVDVEPIYWFVSALTAIMAEQSLGAYLLEVSDPEGAYTTKLKATSHIRIEHEPLE
jgi:hypothetical protein